MVDIVANLPGPLMLGSDAPAPIRLLPGGSAANTACWLAVAGASVRLIARVGCDPHGDQSRIELEAAGVVTDLQIDRVRATGRCIVLVGVDGERTMVPDTGANAGLDPSQFAPASFPAGGHLHVSAYSLLGAARPAALAAMAQARAAAMTISVDAASSAPLLATGAAAFRNCLGSELLLFANEAEAAALTGLAEPRAAVSALALEFGCAVVKVGASGAYWADRNGEVLHRSAAAVSVLDTTGAGDAFAAGFLAALGAGQPPGRALEAANRLAGVACREVGGRPPIGLSTT